MVHGTIASKKSGSSNFCQFLKIIYQETVKNKNLFRKSHDT
jgi:hypothetical protein